MKASKSEHEPSIAPINPIYESTIEPEQFATEDLRHDYEDLFRKNIELIKLERFTVENTEVDALKHILRLLVNPVKNIWNQLARRIAAELQLGNLMLSRLESAQTDETKTYCVSILAVLGLLHVVVDRAREAKRDKREYGGSFMIFGEADIEQEDNEVTLRRKVELMSKYKQSFEEIEKDDLQRIEIENQKHKEVKNKNHRQIIQLKQQIQSQGKLNIDENKQEIRQEKDKDQEIGERLINMSQRVNETDKLVEIRRHEVDLLEQEARQQQNQIKELRQLSNNQLQQLIKRDEQKIQQNSDEEEVINSKINKKEKLKEKEKIKQNEKEKEKELKRKNENINQKIVVDKKEGSFEDKQNKEMKQETLLQKGGKEKMQEIEIDKEKQRKKEIGIENKKEQSNQILIDNNSISNIATQIQQYEFKPIITKYLAVLDKQKNGGIAIVRGNEVIPQKISFNEMINLKGVVFTLPQQILYMNGIQIWKRSDSIDKITEQQQQSSTSQQQSQQQQSQQISQTKIQDKDKWMRLNIQLDFETEERIVKFFIGKDIIEFVGVGIKKLPKDIKVVAMSQGSYKVYKSDNQERKGEEVTQLIPWSD